MPLCVLIRSVRLVAISFIRPTGIFTPSIMCVSSVTDIFTKFVSSPSMFMSMLWAIVIAECGEWMVASRPGIYKRNEGFPLEFLIFFSNDFFCSSLDFFVVVVVVLLLFCVFCWLKRK